MKNSPIMVFLIPYLIFSCFFQALSQPSTATPKLVVQNSHSGGISSVAFSPDGILFAAAGSDKTVRLWSLEKGTVIRTFKEHESDVHTVAFSPDGKTVASGSGMNSYIGTKGRNNIAILWNMETGEILLETSEHSRSVEALAFSPDGKTLATGGADVFTWSTETGEKIRTFRETRCFMTASLAFSPDGTILAEGIGTKEVCKMGATPVLIDETKKTSSGTETVSQKGSPDSRRSGLWNSSSGESVSWDPGYFNLIAFTPDGNPVTMSQYSGGDIKIWKSGAEAVTKRLPYHKAIRDFSISPDGNFLAVATSDLNFETRHSVEILSAKTAELISVLKGHTDTIQSVAYSPDGNIIASSSIDGTVNLWNPTTGRLLVTLTVFPDDTWIVTDPNGHFDCSGCTAENNESAEKYIRWRIDNKSYPAEKFYDDFFTHRLLVQAIQ